MSLPPLTPLPRMPPENKGKKSTTSVPRPISGPKNPPPPPAQPKYQPPAVEPSSDEITMLQESISSKRKGNGGIECTLR